jgi:hypothetical protein
MSLVPSLLEVALALYIFRFLDVGLEGFIPGAGGL